MASSPIYEPAKCLRHAQLISGLLKSLVLEIGAWSLTGFPLPGIEPGMAETKGLVEPLPGSLEDRKYREIRDRRFIAGQERVLSNRRFQDIARPTASKTALNAITPAFAIELQKTGIKFRVVSLSFAATAFNDFQGTTPSRWECAWLPWTWKVRPGASPGLKAHGLGK
jgi:hypothetical protein